MRSRLLVPVLLCVLGGCMSTPRINYYTLGTESSGAVKPAVNLIVERFSTTEALGRAQLMIATSETEVEYYISDHWVGGLGEIIQQKLASEFGPAVENRRALVVSGIVLTCQQVELRGVNEARMKLHVTVRDAELKRYQGSLFEKTYEARRPVPGRASSSVVEALSRCAELIAAEIANDVAAYGED